MRKLLLCLILATAILPAQAAQFGIGVVGGMNIPIIQEDQGNGTIFGVKGKLNLIPGVSVEPNLNFAKYGESKNPYGNRPGSKVTSYGIDAILGSGLPSVGVKMYGLIGVGIYSIKRDFDETLTKIGWATGLGLEVGFMEQVSVELRGKLNVISSDGGGSKKSAAVTGGVNYYFGY